MSFARQTTALVFSLREPRSTDVNHADLLVERYYVPTPWGAIVLDATYENCQERLRLKMIQVGACEVSEATKLTWLTWEVYVVVDPTDLINFAHVGSKRVYSQSGYIRTGVYEKLLERVRQEPDERWLLAGGQLDSIQEGEGRPLVNMLHEKPIQFSDTYPEALLKLQGKLRKQAPTTRKIVAELVNGSHDMYILASYEDGSSEDLEVLKRENYRSIQAALDIREEWFSRNVERGYALVPLLVPEQTELVALTTKLPAKYADEHGVDTRANEPAMLAFSANSGKPLLVTGIPKELTDWLRGYYYKTDVALALKVPTQLEGNVYSVSVATLAKVLEKFKSPEPTLVVVKAGSPEHDALRLLASVRDNLTVRSLPGGDWHDENTYHYGMRVIATALAQGKCERVMVVRELMFDGAQLLDL